MSAGRLYLLRVSLSPVAFKLMSAAPRFRALIQRFQYIRDSGAERSRFELSGDFATGYIDPINAKSSPRDHWLSAANRANVCGNRRVAGHMKNSSDH